MTSPTPVEAAGPTPSWTAECSSRTRVVFGPGAAEASLGPAVAKLAEELRIESRHAFLICSGSARSRLLAAQISTSLSANGIESSLFADAEPHVPRRIVRNALAALPEHVRLVVCVGGGSAIGLGKALALEREDLVTVNVPTTMSGSELTSIFGVTEDPPETSDSASADDVEAATTSPRPGPRPRKTVGKNSKCLARLVVYDPTLLLTLTPRLACTSSFNAMAHAVETLWSPASESLTPTDLVLAEESIRRLANGIRMIVKARELASENTPTSTAGSSGGGSAGGQVETTAPPSAERISLAVAYELLYGAYLSALCLERASMAVHHKLCHIIASSYGTPHADTHTVLLPHSILFNAPAAPHAVSRIARALRNAQLTDAAPSDPVGAGDAPALLFDLMLDAQVPTSLRGLSLLLTLPSLADAAQAAVDGAGAYVNPRVLDLFGVQSLLLDAFHGRRPSLVSHPLRSLALLKGASGPHSVLPVAASVHVPLNSAKLVVIAVHGRYSTAERIVQIAEQSLGGPLFLKRHKVAIVAPQASGSSWYPKKFNEELTANEPFLTSALDALRAVVVNARKEAGLPAAGAMLLGFSQGACLAATYAALQQPDEAKVGSLVALSGAIVGPNSGQSHPMPAHKVNVHAFFSCAQEDSHVPIATVNASIAHFHSIGAASVQHETFKGNSHKPQPSQGPIVRELALRAIADVRGHEFAQRQALSVRGGSGAPGFAFLGGHVESEALPGVVPRSQRMPRYVPYRLYAECITGGAFGADRSRSKFTWVYRIHPSVATISQSIEIAHPTLLGNFSPDNPAVLATPTPVRWDPLPAPASDRKVDFVDGLITIAGTGSAMSRSGMAIHAYVCNSPMQDRAMQNSDGDMLIVPQSGVLVVRTELGMLQVHPGEILLMPRGFRFQVGLDEGDAGAGAEAGGGEVKASGWIAESFGGPFRLPNRGVIGTHGLAEERHFIPPTAGFENRDVPGDGFRITVRFCGKLFDARSRHSPFDVVGWSGSNFPCKYDVVANFSPLGTTKKDHVDPSVHSVLTVPLGGDEGVSLIDFVAFVGRFDPTEDTFKPPFYHRNMTTEFNAIVALDAEYAGFKAGSSWLTPAFSPHGVAGSSTTGFLAAEYEAVETPKRLSDDSLWIMFESGLPLVVARQMVEARFRDASYREFFSGLPRRFAGSFAATAGQGPGADSLPRAPADV